MAVTVSVMMTGGAFRGTLYYNNIDDLQGQYFATVDAGIISTEILIKKSLNGAVVAFVSVYLTLVSSPFPQFKG
jgi:hypothetical protein